MQPIAYFLSANKSEPPRELKEKNNKYVEEDEGIERLALLRIKKMPPRQMPLRPISLKPMLVKLKKPRKKLKKAPKKRHWNSLTKRDIFEVKYYNYNTKSHYTKYYIKPKD